MPEWSWTLLVSFIISPIIATGLSYLALRGQREKTKAEVAEIYKKMSSEQAIEIEELQDEVGGLKKTLDEWAKGIAILIDQIVVKHNDTPDWRPNNEAVKRDT